MSMETRAGAFFIPSYELALWASRKGAKAMAEAPASPAVAQRQESASAGAAHGRGGTMNAPEDALVTVTLACHWCRRIYTREIEPEFVGAVLNGGICDACYDADEAAR